MKVARNEKRKKLLGFSFNINIGNFEAFLWNLNLSTNHSFWRCVYLYQKVRISEHLQSFTKIMSHNHSWSWLLGLKYYEPHSLMIGNDRKCSPITIISSHICRIFRSRIIIDGYFRNITSTQNCWHLSLGWLVGKPPRPGRKKYLKN